MLKKWSSIFFFLCLLSPFIGTYIWLQVEKYQVRQQVKEYLLMETGEENLVWLKFSKAEAEAQLEWEHDKEFAYQNKMYDVVQQRVDGDTLYLLCWPDEAETRLDHQLDLLAGEILKTDPEGKEAKMRLAGFMKVFYHKQPPYHPSFWSDEGRGPSFLYLSSCSILSIAPPKPPPWVS